MNPQRGVLAIRRPMALVAVPGPIALGLVAPAGTSPSEGPARSAIDSRHGSLSGVTDSAEVDQ
jgi:hypothetical protein